MVQPQKALNQPIPDNFKLPCPPKKEEGRWMKIMEKVKDYAILAFQTLLATVLFITNPSIFSVGFLVGIIMEEQVHDAINKIVLIWKKLTFTMSLITGFATFLSLPVTWAAGSFLYASYVGCTLSTKAQKAWNTENPDQTFSFI